MWSPHRLSEGSSKLTGYFFFFLVGWSIARRETEADKQSRCSSLALAASLNFRVRILFLEMVGRSELGLILERWVYPPEQQFQNIQLHGVRLVESEAWKKLGCVSWGMEAGVRSREGLGMELFPSSPR